MFASLKSETFRLAAIGTLLLTLLAATSAHAADLKVGVVDFTTALEATEKDGALKELKAEVDKKKATLKTLETEIRTMESDLKLNGPMLSEEKKKAAFIEYQKKAYEYQQTLMVYEQEMAKERAKVLGEIHQKMQIISTEIAQENKLDLMLERNEGAVIYFNGAFDFTDELIKRYNAQN